MTKYKCFIKHCKVTRSTNSALVQHLHHNHTKSQREEAPKEKYSQLLYDLCNCGFLVNFKKPVCNHCGAQHLKKTPKDISLERKSTSGETLIWIQIIFLLWNQYCQLQ